MRKILEGKAVHEPKANEGRKRAEEDVPVSGFFMLPLDHCSTKTGHSRSSPSKDALLNLLGNSHRYQDANIEGLEMLTPDSITTCSDSSLVRSPMRLIPDLQWEAKTVFGAVLWSRGGFPMQPSLSNTSYGCAICSGICLTACPDHSSSDASAE